MFSWLFKSSDNKFPLLKKQYKNNDGVEITKNKLMGLNFLQETVDNIIKGNVINNIEKYSQTTFKYHENFYKSWVNLDNVKNIIDKKINIIYFFGNNGIGKTTSIVNLARIFQDQNHKVLLIAADEFRGGAVEQLISMANNYNLPVYSSVMYDKEPSLPQIIFDGIQKNYNEYDVILIDTAGRSHTDLSLIDNLKKQYDISHKILKDENKNIISIWVNDGNIVNAFQQQQNFFNKIPVDFIIMTKIKNDRAYYNFLYIMDKIKKPIIFYGPNANELKIFNEQTFEEKLS